MNILIIDDGLLPFDKNRAKAFGKSELMHLEHEHRELNRALARAFAAHAQNVLVIFAAEDGAAAPGHFTYSGDEGVLSLGASVEGRGSFAGRYLRFCRILRQSAAVICGLFKPDIVIYASITPFCAAAAEKIVEISGAVLIATIPCSFPETFRRLGRMRCSNPVLAVLKHNSVCSLRHATVFGYYPNLFQSYLGGRLIAPPPVTANKAYSEEAVFAHDSVAALSGGEIFTLCYCGRLCPGLSLRALISAAKKVIGRFILAIVGDGEYKAELRRAARECGANNVCFYDGVPENDISFVLSAADAVFVSESSTIKGAACEYPDFLRAFAAGKPAVAAVAANAAFIKECGGAVLAQPENSESIAAAITAIINADKETRCLLGLACADFVAKHSFDAFADGFLSAIDSLKSKEKQQ